MNANQRALVMGSWKSAVGVATGALLTNLADPAYPVFSGLWWRHLLIAVGILILSTEARYWKQWAESGTQRPLPEILEHAQQATKEAGAAISQAKTVAKEQAQEQKP